MARPLVKCLPAVCMGTPLVEILEADGFEVRHSPSELDRKSENAVIQELAGCVAAVAGTETFTRRVLQSLPQLRVIARLGVGMDSIDLPACDELGIAVATTPGINQHAVAEHAIALLMAVARDLRAGDLRVRTGMWEEIPPPRVQGATLGVVGLGRTGQGVATRGQGLGMRVLAYEPFPNADFIREHPIELCSLNELLSRSDYVSLHLPATAETRHLFNASRLAGMKRGAVLINTARGALIDEAALVAALRSGHLRGAGLDVFEHEPLPLESPLLSLPNVLLTPHVAGLDQEGRVETFRMAARSIVDLRQGVWPLPQVQNLKQHSQWEWERPAQATVH